MTRERPAGRSDPDQPWDGRSGLATLDAGEPDPRTPGPPRRALAPFPRPLANNGMRAPDGPLIARSHPPRSHPPRAPQRGRVGRFIAAFGWRAFVIPVLAVVTFITLLDTVSTAGTDSAAETGTTATADTEPTAPVTPDPTEVAEGEQAPEVTEEAPAGPPPYVEQGAGTLAVVSGSSAVSGAGPLIRFIVEVEDGINVDGAAFAAAVEATLVDPRGWGAAGRMSFQRVDGGDYDFRVSLVSPVNVETYCPGVGTEGYTSCRYGERAVINLARWETAVPDYQGNIPLYRQYVVNHEVGHALGNGHEDCPGEGQPAPVMQQQTLGLNGCLANPWPFPNG